MALLLCCRCSSKDRIVVVSVREFVGFIARAIFSKIASSSSYFAPSSLSSSMNSRGHSSVEIREEGGEEADKRTGLCGKGNGMLRARAYRVLDSFDSES